MRSIVSLVACIFIGITAFRWWRGWHALEAQPTWTTLSPNQWSALKESLEVPGETAQSSPSPSDDAPSDEVDWHLESQLRTAERALNGPESPQLRGPVDSGYIPGLFGDPSEWAYDRLFEAQRAGRSPNPSKK